MFFFSFLFCLLFMTCIDSEQHNRTSLIIYAGPKHRPSTNHSKSALYESNFLFFLQHGLPGTYDICTPGEFDVALVLSEETYSLYKEQIATARERTCADLVVHVHENRCYDMESTRVAIRATPLHRYTHFLFLNCGLLGPLLPLENLQQNNQPSVPSVPSITNSSTKSARQRGDKSDSDSTLHTTPYIPPPINAYPYWAHRFFDMIQGKVKLAGLSLQYTGWWRERQVSHNPYNCYNSCTICHNPYNPYAICYYLYAICHNPYSPYSPYSPYAPYAPYSPYVPYASLLPGARAVYAVGYRPHRYADYHLIPSHL
jgi:hypothetical protein